MTQQPTELRALVNAGIISEATAQQIADYWQQHQPPERPSRLPIVFSLLGGLLVGLGIILMVAHNWDQLSHFSKMVVAFLPVIAGQVAAWLSISKYKESRAWREGSAVFLILALGACIAMVSQIYHVEGSLDGFLFAWIWLALPVMYVLDSGLASLLFWLGISMYALNAGYDSYPRQPVYWYWVFVVLALPYYWLIRQRRPGSNAEMYHNWVIPLSLSVCLGTLFVGHDLLNWVNYQILYVILFLIGRWLFAQEEKLLANGWMIIGLFATVFIGVAQSFYDFWSGQKELWSGEALSSVNFYVFIALLLTLIGLIAYILRKDRTILQHPIPYLGVLAVFIHLIGIQSPFVGALIGNLTVFGLGLYYIWLGTRNDHLAILNFGLLMLTVLIACRFFDTDISFAIRGLLFLLLGTAFFAANLYLIRRRAKNTTPHE